VAQAAVRAVSGAELAPRYVELGGDAAHTAATRRRGARTAELGPKLGLVEDFVNDLDDAEGVPYSGLGPTATSRSLCSSPTPPCESRRPKQQALMKFRGHRLKLRRNGIAAQALSAGGCQQRAISQVSRLISPTGLEDQHAEASNR
jgi:hypothetical protein